MDAAEVLKQRLNVVKKYLTSFTFVQPRGVSVRSIEMAVKNIKLL